MRRDVRQSLNGRQYFLKTAAHFTAGLDVFQRFGTTHRVEAQQVKLLSIIQCAIALAIGGAVCLLYFFAPSAYSFFPQCGFHSLTGWDCPGCGTLRATHQLLHGNVADAFRLNPLFMVLLPFFGLLLMPKVRNAFFQAAWRKHWMAVLLALLIAFTIWRNLKAVS